MSQTRTEPEPGAPPPRQPRSPDLAASLREIGRAARGTAKEAGKSASALRDLAAADFSLARGAFGRTIVFAGVAVVFAVTAWMLLMAGLIALLSLQLGLPWSVSLLGAAVLSAGGAYFAARKAEDYFDHASMRATRRQLARLSLGELAKLVPEAVSPSPGRGPGPGVSRVDEDGVEVTRQ